jgi:catechol 2,3-dioxygenase-like lactoylglutathione lyase family enzyme
MRPSLALIALIVHDYDDAIAWFTEKLASALVTAEDRSD